ncbi:MAG TPA: hypothetical protein VK541_23105 [Pedobacter sp.]|uniref:DUF6965 family protein n=1 Tax=Pedobacter sp. TaxID=1411316 RepID=UPI002D1985E7|nr:hypothetical protein [Pedobacter sp.]HMI05397.1 hypothetical protein [Pedobacter sp.]
MNADEYEAAFQGIDLPATAELFPGTIVSDVPAFINNSISLLRTVRNPKQTDVIQYRLDRLLELIASGEQTI